ncbi:hypothetical protein WT83_14150 [Burkholderia territorii]|uniref:Uncharacterized protein n=1 Tax=Burkholderia territorii TaxID=1503055 RepID=A0A108ET01_9BURK|nr:hypothetical protein [Burkholderia territorii]KWN16842.1 hypothetical protein WT83_14150 [Burkholderia territorii]
MRSAVEYRQRLIAIKALVNDTARPAEERLTEIGKLLEDLSEKPPTSHAASVRETLTDDHHRIRNFLVPLRELELSGREAEPSLRQLEFLSTLHDLGVTELPADCEVPVSASWRDLVEGEDRARAMRALEASAITGLRRGLRRGLVWISHSLSFRARDQLLIPLAQWECERDRHLSSLGLSHKAEPFLERLSSHLKAGLAALEEALAAGRVTVGTDGALHLSAIEALPTDGLPRRMHDLMFRELGSRSWQICSLRWTFTRASARRC